MTKSQLKCLAPDGWRYGGKQGGFVSYFYDFKHAGKEVSVHVRQPVAFLLTPAFQGYCELALRRAKARVCTWVH